MSQVTRQGKNLGGTEYRSINKAKAASRELQKHGTEVRVIPHKTQQQFPIANAGRLPHEGIMNKEKAS
jgi:hypothetical protein